MDRARRIRAGVEDGFLQGTHGGAHGTVGVAQPLSVLHRAELRATIASVSSYASFDVVVFALTLKSTPTFCSANCGMLGVVKTLLVVVR